MSFPRIYCIVRDGLPRRVRVQNRDDLVSLRTELELLRCMSGTVPAKAFEAIRRLVGRKQAAADSEQVARLADLCGVLCDARAPENLELTAQLDQQFPNIRGELNMASIDREGEQFKQDLVSELQGAASDDSAELDLLLQEASSLLQDSQSEQMDAPVDEAPAAADSPAVAPQTNSSDASEQSVIDEFDLDIEAATEAVSDEAAAIADMDPEMAQLLAETDSASIIAAGPEPVEAVEEVGQALDSAEAEIDAIASAFEQATSELDVPTPTDPAPEIDEVDTAADSVAVELPAVDAEPLSDTEFEASSSSDVPAGGVSNIRERIVAEVQSLVQLLEELEQQDAKAKAVLSKAAAFTQAMELSQQAESELAAAQAAYQQAQQRLEQTRRNWEAAQQQAAAAAMQLQT